MKRKEVNKLIAYEDIKRYADQLINTRTVKSDFSKDWETFEAELDNKVMEDLCKQYQIPIPETNVRFAKDANDAKPGNCFADADGDVYVKLDDGSIEKIYSTSKQYVDNKFDSAVDIADYTSQQIQKARQSGYAQAAARGWTFDPRKDVWVNVADAAKASQSTNQNLVDAISAISAQLSNLANSSISGQANGAASGQASGQTSGGMQNVQAAQTGCQQASKSPQSSQASGAHVGAWKSCIWQGQQCVCQLDPRTGNYIIRDLTGILVGYARPQEILSTEDPLAAQRAKAENTIATIDVDSDYHPKGMEPYASKVYYHDRWPTIPSNVLVDNAIKLLKEKRNVDITVNSKYGNILYGQDPEQFVSIIYKIRKTVSRIGAWDDETETLIEARIPERAFDRSSTDIDSKANLRGRINTNDYITLRIAYLLYIAAGKAIKEDINYTSDILTVIGHNTRQILPF